MLAVAYLYCDRLTKDCKNGIRNVMRHATEAGEVRAQQGRGAHSTTVRRRGKGIGETRVVMATLAPSVSLSRSLAHMHTHRTPQHTDRRSFEKLCTRARVTGTHDIGPVFKIARMLPVTKGHCNVCLWTIRESPLGDLLTHRSEKARGRYLLPTAALQHRTSTWPQTPSVATSEWNACVMRRRRVMLTPPRGGVTSPLHATHRTIVN